MVHRDSVSDLIRTKWQRQKVFNRPPVTLLTESSLCYPEKLQQVFLECCFYEFLLMEMLSYSMLFWVRSRHFGDKYLKKPRQLKLKLYTWMYATRGLTKKKSGELTL